MLNAHSSHRWYTQQHHSPPADLPPNLKFEILRRENTRRMVPSHMSHAIRHMSYVTRHTSNVTTSSNTKPKAPSKCFFHSSSATRHSSHVTCLTSHVTRHTSHVTRHTSHVTRHTSYAIHHTENFSLPNLTEGNPRSCCQCRSTAVACNC